MDIEICPLDKVLVDEEAICLGMEQSTVEAAIGKGILVGKRYYYFNDEMAIDYNDNKVDFIEFLSGTDGMLKPSIKSRTVNGMDRIDEQHTSLCNTYPANMKKVLCYVALFCMDNTFFVYFIT